MKSRFGLLAGIIGVGVLLSFALMPSVLAADTVTNTAAFAMENTPPKEDFRIVFDGNSWVAGSGSSEDLNFPNQTRILLQAAGKTASILNFGVPGQTIIQMQSDATTQIDPNHSTYDFLIGLELVNQWGLSTTYTKEQLYSQYKQYFLDRKAAGFKYVFACTPHDQGYYSRTSGGNWATVRAYFVAQMKAEFPALGIGVIDCGSDPRLSDWTDTTYFAPDKIHLNNAGQAVQAQYACDALLSSALYQYDGARVQVIMNEVNAQSKMFYRLVAVEPN